MSLQPTHPKLGVELTAEAMAAMRDGHLAQLDISNRLASVAAALDWLEGRPQPVPGSAASRRRS